MDKLTLLRQIREAHAPIAALATALDDEALAGPAPDMEGWARASDDELFTRDPHPWLDRTVAETVIADSIAHDPDHVPHLR